MTILDTSLDQSGLNVTFSQKGLAYFPDYAIYATYVVRDTGRTTHDLWQTLARELDERCQATDHRTVVLLGVGFELWDSWSVALGYTRPQGMGSRAKLAEHSAVFGDSGGDLWFHIKSDAKDDAQRMLEIIETAPPACWSIPISGKA